ncbi:hypothetical protein CL629_01575 [bacterium]|nr:hypothetical protein [bacterium]|tara:strand:+ start:1554 stop:2843 length:1290 start_codon:yes stop_codon:yes gene_type:complete
MRFLILFKISIKAMHSNLVRTGLTVLGMVIGIATIVVVFSAGEGVRGLLLGQIEAFGTDVIETEIKVPSSKTGGASERQSATNLAQGVQVTTLTLDDMEDIMRLPNVKDGYAGIMSQETVSYEGERRKAFLLGASASYIDIDQSEMGEGRFFTDGEDRSLSPVVVLGTKMKEILFGESDAIGRSVKIRDAKYRVIGIMEERGAVMGIDFDDFVYMPLETLQKRVSGIGHILYMVHQLHDLEIAEETAEDIRAILRMNHSIPPPALDEKRGWADTGKDDFRVMTMAEAMDVWENIMSTLTILLLGIVAVSLVVGGVGIMNVMYVIVTERTHEIGLRKAVGAKYSDIMWQFLIEAVLIALTGGIVGIILGLLLSYGMSIGAGSYGLDWGFSVPIQAFVVSILFSFGFGILFGVFPARKAARMDPIVALRSE